MPIDVKLAIKCIWISIIITCVISLLGKWSGSIDSGTFVFYLIFTAIFCIIPYKLSQGSNAARYVFLTLVVLNVLLLLGDGFSGMDTATALMTIITTPLEIYIAYKLFQPVADRWFKKQGPKARV